MAKLRVLVLLALAAAAAACGQKGPLVLPDAQHPRKKVKLPSAPKPSSTTPTNPDAAATPSAAPAAVPNAAAGAGAGAGAAPNPGSRP